MTEPAFVAPASFGQHRLWFLEQLDPGTGRYNLPTAVRLRGPLAYDVVERAFEALVTRHEALRTTLRDDDGALVQVVSSIRIRVRRIDLQILSEAAREDEARRLVDDEARRPFDLVRGPLARFGFVILAPDDHVLFMTLHHAIADGWSIDVLLSELATYCRTFAEGRPAELRSPTIQYADYAAWERATLGPAVVEPHLAWFREHLEGASFDLPLPLDREVRTDEAGSHVFALGREGTARVRELAAGRRTTVFVALMAAFGALLQRITWKDDLTIGYPVANRRRSETEGVVGFFVNTLVARLKPAPERSFADLVDTVRDDVLAAEAHSAVPFDLLVKALAPRGRTDAALFRVAFVLQNTFGATLDFGALEASLLPEAIAAPKFDLCLTFEERGGELVGRFDYDRGLFDTTTIAGWATQYRCLLEDACARPSASIATLSLADAETRARLLRPDAVAAASTATTSTPTLDVLFEAVAAAHPDRVAVTCEGEVLTYAALDAAANRLAHRLVSIAPDPEVDRDALRPIAICVGRSVASVVAILAVLKAGHAYVPVDPDYPVDRIAFMLRDSRAPVLVADGSSLARVRGAGALPDDVAVVDLDAADVRADRSVRPTAPRRRCPPTGAGPDTLPAYVIYTSGSTGQPKGCVVSHRNVVRLFRATEADFDFGAEDVWALFHSTAFDFSVWEIWGALLHGGRLVVVPYLVARAPDELYRLLCREGVTILNQTPTAFAHLAAVDARERAAASSLRAIVFGGERMDPRSLRDWFARRGDTHPRMVNMYGITETTVHVTLRELRCDDLASPKSVIGRPIRDLEVLLLDPSGEPVPPGAVGEIHVGGEGVSLGYLRRPALDAERFVTCSRKGHGEVRLYRSGDLARRDANGELEYLGRADRQVKVRGYRIELGEIEAALMEVPGVASATVIVDPNEPSRLFAYVTRVPPAREESPTATTPRETHAERTDVSERGLVERTLETLRRRLPPYMIPAALHVLPALPMTVHGKVDVRALPRPRGSTAPAACAPVEVTPIATDAASRDTIAQTLLAIWSDVLGRSDLGLDDDFFTVGGDSIVSLRIVSRAKRAGLAVTPRAIFEHPTIARLGAWLATSPPASPEASPRMPARSASPSPDGEQEGDFPLLPIQRWLCATQPLDALDHFVFWTRLSVAPVSREDLVAIVTALLAHHAALRVRFEGLGTETARAVVMSPEDDRIRRVATVVDVRALPLDEREGAIGAHLEATHASLDLRAGPVIRLVLYRGAEGHGDAETARDHLAIVAHHMVVDGVSWRILREDVATLLAARRSGGALALPAATTTLASWARAARIHARSDALADERAHWIATLRKALPSPLLAPTTRTTPNADDADDVLDLRRAPDAGAAIAAMATVRVPIPRTTTEALATRCIGAWGARIDDLLLGALLLAVRAAARVDRIVIDVEGHGREDLFADHDVSRTIGWFTSKYPLCLEAPSTEKGDDVAAFVAAVRDARRETPNRGAGYGILRWLGHDAEIEALETAAAIPICFNYLGRWSNGRATAEGGGGDARSATLETSTSPRFRRLYAIEINAEIEDGVLTFEIGHDPSTHSRRAIERLGRALAEAIARVVDEAIRARAPERPSYERYPATPMQRGMLFHTLLGHASDYVVQYEYLLRGVDLARFGRALDAVVARTPILRTAFAPCESDGYVQIVAPHVAPLLSVIDGEHLDEAARRQIVAGDAHAAFDLGRAPLLRCTALRTGGDEARFLFTFHHAILDGWSVALVVDDLARAYDGEALPLRRPYREHVAWLSAQDRGAAIAYWRQRLDAITESAVGRIPALAPAGEQQTRALPGRESLALGVATSHAIVEDAARLGVTTSVLVQAAWALTLAHVFGSQGSREAIFGATSAGRPTTDGADAIGPHITTLPVRLRWHEGTTLGRWLRDALFERIDAEAHGHLPLPEIERLATYVEEGTRPRGGRRPLFDTLVVFQNYPATSRSARSGAWSMTDIGGRDETHYPITLVVTPGDRFTLEIGHRGPRTPGSPPPGRVARELLGALVAILHALTRAEGETAIDAVLETARQALDRSRDHALASERALVGAREPSARLSSPLAARTDPA